MLDVLTAMGVVLDPVLCPDSRCRARGTCPIASTIDRCPDGARVELPCGAAIDKRARASIETYQLPHRRAS